MLVWFVLFLCFFWAGVFLAVQYSRRLLECPILLSAGITVIYVTHDRLHNYGSAEWRLIDTKTKISLEGEVCSSVDRVATAWSPGFGPQPCVNQACWYILVILTFGIWKWEGQKFKVIPSYWGFGCEALAAQVWSFDVYTSSTDPLG